ncbi:sodium/solute symporter-like protein [Leptotrombidium deliense]|uniref:Sodium/solute symporter-like protein n=1 Tax=Leptotrombidium deliense TaxID=299467 RepID=A0A443SIM7_9ACAR|nr:sodium/solute symporter-like protein [Leptotrombidium deliense]
MVTLDGATKTFSTADFAVFASMLFVSSGIGVFYAWKDRKNKSNTEFLTSNRNLHWFPVAMSLMASFQSSVTILGYPAEMYLRGTQFWFVIFSATLAAVTAAELFLPVYYSLSFTSVNKCTIV